eukprot:TRINITY_DN13844_c0_g1_i1.p1 TRINITY_DN13844_c0_g1~~TRINITY_DN13844_c0_g1_i1.p1  ORF type:complete len:187 (-),score=76.31 TRINITY_DN13844_c0_g1_i1:189-749(-)
MASIYSQLILKSRGNTQNHLCRNTFKCPSNQIRSFHNSTKLEMPFPGLAWKKPAKTRRQDVEQKVRWRPSYFKPTPESPAYFLVKDFPHDLAAEEWKKIKAYQKQYEEKGKALAEITEYQDDTISQKELTSTQLLDAEVAKIEKEKRQKKAEKASKKKEEKLQSESKKVAKKKGETAKSKPKPKKK